MSEELKSFKEMINARVTREANTNNTLSTAGKTTDNSTPGINQLAGGQIQEQEGIKKQIAFDIRCCCPAIIKSIDLERAVVTCQPVIKEKIQMGTQELREMQLPEIADIPLIYPSSQNGFSITFPVQEGDECLLFFADTCIDAWWQSGGIQSQFEERRHDLSDAFCLPCQMSQPFKNTISSNSLDIRFKGDINITATGNVNIIGAEIHLN